MRPSEWLNTLAGKVSETLYAEIQGLVEKTLETETTPLRVCLLGAFSVGKSSLLNSLIGEPLLYAAREESTALPTFLEHGNTRQLEIIGQDGSSFRVEEDTLQEMTTHAPEGAACAVMALPLPWLKDVSVIDLPGLGSVSAGNAAYTRIQLELCDAVIYLIPPRGPSQPDIDILKEVKALGKHLKIVVSQWDVVEEGIARGEKAPSLDKWAAEIQTKTGLPTFQLEAVHHQGLGKESLLSFIQKSVTARQAIRQRRFEAALLPCLEMALVQLEQEKASVEVRSEEDARALHQTLLARKQALTTLRGTLYEEQTEAMKQLETTVESAIQLGKTQLDTQLLAFQAAVQTEAHLPDYTTHSSQALRTALLSLAERLSQLSQTQEHLQVSDAAIQTLNLTLPAPEPIEPAQFLNRARLEQLAERLQVTEAETQQLAEKETVLAQNLQTGEEDQLQSEIGQLRSAQHQLVAQPLPTVFVEEPPKGNGAVIGRILGEVADLALIFVTPEVAGIKMAGVLGKTPAIAKNISSGLKVAQKLQFMEKLSFGYWGERIGGMMSGGGSVREEVDPEALRARQQETAELNQRIHQMEGMLAKKQKLADERTMTGWALEQSQKERAKLQADLERLKREGEAAFMEAQSEQQTERQGMLERQLHRAHPQWIRQYETQAESMLNTLRDQFKTYWTEQVEVRLSNQVAEIDQLMAQKEQAPEEKAAQLAILHAQEAVLKQCLVQLQ